MGNLIPPQVSSKYNKKAQAAVLMHDGHGILIALPYKAGAAKVARQEDYIVAYRGYINVSIGEGISYTIIQLYIEVY